ncbi:rab-like protein 6 [Platysternon megacephalum]|uniref:Rab-like protein 6 n=1 Tax=Platysternon megacephalum TaxID=55544 RepID=A0A4D9DXE1_9SAUR|nr:rab-like protein 6 [Platysternon megacephalum]
MMEKGPEESNACLKSETGRRGNMAASYFCGLVSHLRSVLWDNCSPVPELNVQTTHKTFSSWRKICKWRETRKPSLKGESICFCSSCVSVHLTKRKSRKVSFAEERWKV